MRRDVSECHRAVRGFCGLPHRLKLIGERDGVRYYDDSKSTTPGACVKAVEAFADVPHVHVIVGGYDKGVDLAPMLGCAARR